MGTIGTVSAAQFSWAKGKSHQEERFSFEELWGGQKTKWELIETKDISGLDSSARGICPKPAVESTFVNILAPDN